MDFIKKIQEVNAQRRQNITKGFINAEEYISKAKEDDRIIEKSEQPKVDNENNSSLRIQAALEVLGLGKEKKKFTINSNL